jgi:hypothetical protein
VSEKPEQAEILERHLAALKAAFDVLGALVASGAARHLGSSDVMALEQVIEDLNLEIGQWKGDDDE